MTQEEFSTRFGISVNTLRHWEEDVDAGIEGGGRAWVLERVSGGGRHTSPPTKAVRVKGGCG